MENLKKWIEPVLLENDCKLYEISWQTNQNPPVLQISVERNDGTMDLDTCALCSELISEVLDQKDWYSKEYMLEVCSPGAERELRNDEELISAIGKYVYCKLKDPKQGVDQVFGYLEEVKEDTISIAYQVKGRNKNITIDKTNINLIMTAVKV